MGGVMLTSAIPPRNGEGDHAQHGGGGVPHTLRSRPAPSTVLRTVPLPVPGRI
ncbi:hypothetical protein EV283_0579 [Sphingomonas sp. BK036]|nr:hypothetical protein EV283_0579 [Sphingomonas sp. BK036]